LLGNSLASSLTTGDQNIIIGNNSDVGSSGRSGAIIIGNSITASVDNGLFLQHRSPSTVTARPAGFIAGTNELVELTSENILQPTPGIPGGTFSAGTFTVQTVGAITATLASIPTVSGPAGTGYSVSANVALGSAPTDSGMFIIHCRGKNVGGVVTTQPMIMNGISLDIGINTATVSVIPSGANILVQVQGVAAKTINWCGRIEIVSQTF
jgi:hypothetical protein